MAISIADVKSDKTISEYERIMQAKLATKALNDATHDAPGTPAAIRIWLDTYLTDKTKKGLMSAMRH